MGGVWLDSGEIVECYCGCGAEVLSAKARFFFPGNKVLSLEGLFEITFPSRYRILDVCKSSGINEHATRERSARKHLRQKLERLKSLSELGD